MIVRTLQPEDAAAFQVLRLAALLDTPEAFGASHAEEKDQGLAQVARRLEAGPARAVFGAFDGPTLVGCAGLAREPGLRKAHKAFVWGLYVAPSARGRGVARRLMAAAIDLARATPGIAKITLSSDAGNPAAIALYESLGFTVFARERDAMRVGADRRDDVQMDLHLYPPP
jgi:ribosomal protein S18 acetylase RimI-like enzyme